MIASVLVLLAVVAVVGRKMGSYATMAAGAGGTEGAATERLSGVLGAPSPGQLGTLRFVNGKQPTEAQYIEARGKLVRALRAEGYEVKVPGGADRMKAVFGRVKSDQLVLIDAKNHVVYLNPGTADRRSSASQQVIQLSEASARISLGRKAELPAQKIVQAATSNAILHRLGFNGAPHTAAHIHNVTGGTPAHQVRGVIADHHGHITGAAHTINRHIAVPGRAAPAIRQGGRPAGAKTAASYRGATRPASRRAASKPGRGPGRPPGSKNKNPPPPKPKQPRGRPAGSKDKKTRMRATKQERQAGYSRAKTTPKGYQKP